MRAEKAVEYKHSGNNCCQAVLLAYQDKINLDEDTLKAMGSGFGSGMGGMEGNCGALIGAVMTKGFLNTSNAPTKMLAKDMVKKFGEKCGAITCKELKGVGTGTVLCPCDDCIRCAVDLVE